MLLAETSHVIAQGHEQTGREQSAQTSHKRLLVIGESGQQVNQCTDSFSNTPGGFGSSQHGHVAPVREFVSTFPAGPLKHPGPIVRILPDLGFRFCTSCGARRL